MAKVRVGVRRIQKGAGYEAERVGDQGLELYQSWVEINGRRFDAKDVALLDVSYRMFPPGHHDAPQGEIIIRLVSEGFETVDEREPEANTVDFGAAGFQEGPAHAFGNLGVVRSGTWPGGTNTDFWPHEFGAMVTDDKRVLIYQWKPLPNDTNEAAYLDGKPIKVYNSHDWVRVHLPNGRTIQRGN